MAYNEKYGIPVVSTEKEMQHMRKRKKQNLESCKKSKAEWWFYRKLKDLQKLFKFNFKRQIIRDCRLLDFWIAELWIWIEIDWDSHSDRKDYDKRYDLYHMNEKWIIILRVRNFNECDANDAIRHIKKSNNRFERCKEMWIEKAWVYEKHFKSTNFWDTLWIEPDKPFNEQ